MSDYPTKEDLNLILQYQNKTLLLLEHIESIWWQPEWGFKRTQTGLELHTGGWSGNEDIIEKLMETTFWLVCWERSVRGGHYYFEITDTQLEAWK